MDPVAASLANYLVDKLESFPPERRLLVGICGIPASGKTTLAKLIVEKINLLEDGVAVVVGLDGWHFRYLHRWLFLKLLTSPLAVQSWTSLTM
ncbi:hypothetical protein ACGC1H_001197 [Rhizoctonia solani]